MAGFFNSFRFDENGELVQFDEIINGNSPVTPEPAPEPEPEPGPEPEPEPGPEPGPEPEPGPGPEPEPPVDPLNPLGLPPFTIRCKFTSEYTPEMGDSQNLVDSTENVWDITYTSDAWGGTTGLFKNNADLLEVIGANTTGVKNMQVTFYNCVNLTSVVLFDTGDCENLNGTFQNCTNLVAIPLFSTKSCTKMNYTFRGCTNVQTGALALYQQASSQSTEVTKHSLTFDKCGSETVSGAAELAQIPASWGGTAE